MGNLKWGYRVILQVKWIFILSIILTCAESLAFITSIVLQKQLIDDVLLGGQHDLFARIVVLMASAFLAYALLFVYSSQFRQLNITRIRSILSKQLLQYLHRIPVGKLQKERTAHYVHYFTQDITNLSVTLGNQIPRGIQHILSVAVLMTIVGMANPIILLLVSLFSCLYFVIGNYFSKKNKMISNEVEQRKSDLLVHMEEGIASTREVIAYHRIKWETDIYKTIFKRYFDKALQQSKLMNKQMMSSEPLRWGANIFVLTYGGYLVIQDSLSMGMFIVTYQLTSQLMDSFQGTFNFAMMLANQTARMEKLRDVMTGETIGNGSILLSDKIKKLEFRNVSFQYDQTDVLKEISFDIPIGKKVALVGTSGGGKSTITKLLNRQFDQTSGNILVNGIPLEQVQREDWMKRVIIVFQEPYLFPYSIRNNLTMGKQDISYKQLRMVCKTAEIDDYIMELPDGYDTIIGERGMTLSGGQRQRLAIARALLNDPEILILDEATSSLDLETERKIQNNLDLVRKEKTTIIVAHRLSTVQNSDIIYVIDGGRAAEKGVHDELMKYDSTYKKLVYSQIEHNPIDHGMNSVYRK